MYKSTFGEINFAIGRLEYWDWYLSVDVVETIGHRKWLFGNFFWRLGDIDYE